MGSTGDTRFPQLDVGTRISPPTNFQLPSWEQPATFKLIEEERCDPAIDEWCSSPQKWVTPWGCQGVKVTYPQDLQATKIRNHKPINLKSNNPIAKLDGLKISGDLELEKKQKERVEELNWFC